MSKLPLMSERSQAQQIVLVGVVPFVFGLITGIFLGISEPVYVVLSVIGIVGAVGAGWDHVGAIAGAKRGVAAGALFGAGILIAHEVSGKEPKADLPHPAILLIVVTTVFAVVFAALGGMLRARARGREQTA